MQHLCCTSGPQYLTKQYIYNAGSAPEQRAIRDGVMAPLWGCYRVSGRVLFVNCPMYLRDIATTTRTQYNQPEVLRCFPTY